MQPIDKWELIEPVPSKNTALHLSISETEEVLQNPAAVYLLGLPSKLSRNTMASFLGRVATMAGNTTWKDFNWGGMRRPHVQAIIGMLSSSGLAPTTVNTYIAALKGVALEAWGLKMMTAEDFQQIKAIKSVRGKRISKGRALKQSELQALYTACRNDDSRLMGTRDIAIISILVGCGLRRAEVVNLDLASVNLDEGYLRVIGKGNKERIAFPPESVWQRLLTWLDMRGNTAGPLFFRIRKNNVTTGERISTQAIYHILKSRQEQSNVTPFSPHDLRRTFATMLLANGEDIITVKDAMGHESVATTQKYDHRGKDRLRQASQRLNV